QLTPAAPDHVDRATAHLAQRVEGASQLGPRSRNIAASEPAEPAVGSLRAEGGDDETQHRQQNRGSDKRGDDKSWIRYVARGGQNGEAQCGEAETGQNVPYPTDHGRDRNRTPRVSPASRHRERECRAGGATERKHVADRTSGAVDDERLGMAKARQGSGENEGIGPQTGEPQQPQPDQRRGAELTKLSRDVGPAHTRDRGQAQGE